VSCWVGRPPRPSYLAWARRESRSGPRRSAGQARGSCHPLSAHRARDFECAEAERVRLCSRKAPLVRSRAARPACPPRSTRARARAWPDTTAAGSPRRGARAPIVQSHSVSCGAGAGSSDAASASWSSPEKLGSSWMSRCGLEAERAGRGDGERERSARQVHGVPTVHGK
jgi:hypothetical protein